MATQKSDKEKMLQLCIYDHMKKNNLHEAAEIFVKEANLKIHDDEKANIEIPHAKEANMEISGLEFDDETRTIFWESFWHLFTSTISSRVGGANAESSKKQFTETALAMLAGLNSQGAASSQQTLMGNAQQSLLPVMSEETSTNQQWAGNVVVSPDFGYGMSQPVMDLLPPPVTSWRMDESFWPLFTSTMSSGAEEADAESSKKQCTETALAMLAGMNSQGAASSQQTPMGNAQQSLLPVTSQATSTNQQWAENVVFSPDFGYGMSQPMTNLLPPPVTSCRMDESFWPLFTSTMSSGPGEADAESLKKQSTETALAMLAGLNSQGAASFQQTPVGNAQQSLLPVTSLVTSTNQQWAGDVVGSPDLGYGMCQPVTDLLPPPVTSWRMDESFWPLFTSTMSSGAREADAESSKKQSTKTALAMLAGLNGQGAASSQQTPMGNAQQSLLPVMSRATSTNQQWTGNVAVSPDFGYGMSQPVTDLLPPPMTSWHRVGKQPMNAESNYVLGQSATGNFSAAQATGNERLRVSFGQMAFNANTRPFAMPTSGNPSRVQLPSSAHSVVHITRDPGNDFAFGSSNQMVSTRLTGLDSAYPRAAYLNAGESGQTRMTGRGVSDGPEPFSSATRVPTAYLQYMQQAWRTAANTFSQVGSGIASTANMRIATPIWGVTGGNDLKSTHAGTLGEEEAEGGSNFQSGSGRRNY